MQLIIISVDKSEKDYIIIKKYCVSQKKLYPS